MGPFSIEVVLGMLALGAEGKTSEQLLEFIGHKSMEELRSMSLVSRLLEQILLDRGKGGPDVRIANGVWVDEEVKPFQSACFQEVLKTVNKTKAGYIDIQNKKPTELAEIINSWVKEKTNGLIPTFVDEFSLDEVIVFANAVYFKGTWSKSFDANKSKNKDFHLISGEKVQSPS
ncbi:serpin-ZX [Artemisia annua]|uniref:Serpin-ZX n=1 Tax=Artemisia annua TaxID=35608 RepID=A0A2U1KQF1_ARTAN|nr:serpin-ZX [Artemisia annua]